MHSSDDKKHLSTLLPKGTYRIYERDLRLRFSAVEGADGIMRVPPLSADQRDRIKKNGDKLFGNLNRQVREAGTNLVRKLGVVAPEIITTVDLAELPPKLRGALAHFNQLETSLWVTATEAYGERMDRNSLIQLLKAFGSYLSLLQLQHIFREADLGPDEDHADSQAVSADVENDFATSNEFNSRVGSLQLRAPQVSVGLCLDFAKIVQDHPEWGNLVPDFTVDSVSRYLQILKEEDSQTQLTAISPRGSDRSIVELLSVDSSKLQKATQSSIDRAISSREREKFPWVKFGDGTFVLAACNTATSSLEIGIIDAVSKRLRQSALDGRRRKIDLGEPFEQLCQFVFSQYAPEADSSFVPENAYVGERRNGDGQLQVDVAVRGSGGGAIYALGEAKWYEKADSPLASFNDLGRTVSKISDQLRKRRSNLGRDRASCRCGFLYVQKGKRITVSQDVIFFGVTRHFYGGGLYSIGRSSVGDFREAVEFPIMDLHSWRIVLGIVRTRAELDKYLDFRRELLESGGLFADELDVAYIFLNQTLREKVEKGLMKARNEGAAIILPMVLRGGGDHVFEPLGRDAEVWRKYVLSCHLVAHNAVQAGR